MGFMLLTYARWHENLGFGAVGVPLFYAVVAFAGIAVNVVSGCVGGARGEAYAGRVAVVSALACVVAAAGFVRLTIH